MDIKVISSGLMIGSVVAVVATFVYLKSQKAMIEKSFMYGVLASLAAQFMSVLLVGGTSIGSLVLNALFLSMVFYNVIAMFGFRYGNIHESSNHFISFFAGLGIVGNVINLFMFGASSYLIDMYSKTPEFIEALGEDVVNALLDTLSVSLGENMFILLVSFVCAVIVSYISMKLFTISYTRRVIKTNLKGMLVLFVYYLVSVFVPTIEYQVTVQFSLYLLTTLASYLIYLQSRNDEPSIKIIMQ